jgi:signal transduction histidine kinase
VTKIPAEWGRHSASQSVSLPDMRKLYWLYLIDGVLLLVSGFLFAGQSNAIQWMDFLGMNGPWRPSSYSQEFGGALIAFGFAALAVAHFKDSHVHFSSLEYFVAAHFFLALMVWAKQLAFGSSPGGLLILAVAAYPGAAFFYVLISRHPAFFVPETGVTDGDESKIREAAGQEERNRLAQDLHDSVKQQVYAIQTNLATAQARWTTDTSGARDAVDRARSTAHDAISEMTALLDRLRRDPIESVGLTEALRRQAEALGHQSGAEVTTQFGLFPSPNQLPAGAMNVVFRIAQETLANIARHARATHVQLQAGIDAKSSAFSLTIADDGQGFNPETVAAGMGMANIRNRAMEIGGWAEITSSEGKGCTLALIVPLFDPRRERIKRHVSGVLVSPMILLPTGFLIIVRSDFRPYLGPLAALAGLIAAFHAIAGGNLRWRAR